MRKKKSVRLKKDAFFKEMRRQYKALSFDNVLLIPAESDVIPAEVDVSTRFSRNVSVKCPIVSSPMDTVTESKMAIEIAMLGGVGIIHRSLNPEEQAYHVASTKYHLNRYVDNPRWVKKADTIKSVLKMIEDRGFSFRTFPVLDEDEKLAGLLTSNDFDFCLDTRATVEEVMSKDLFTAKEGTKMREAFDMMREKRKKVLPLVSRGKKLVGMYVYSDAKRIITRSAKQYNLDKDGRLKVGAAVGVLEDAFKRVDLLEKRGVDVIVIDAAHGHSKKMVETVKKLKETYPHLDVVAGNISTGEAAKALMNAGVDGIRVGQGPGSICTTRIIAGSGRAQLTAIYEVSRAIRGSGIPVCADGGIRFSGDAVKAIGAGADSVMLGSLISGTDEAPGEVILFKGLPYKVYRGMGSLAAMDASEEAKKRYKQEDVKKEKLVPEGVEGKVPYKGDVSQIIFQFLGGLSSGMGYNGAQNITDLKEKADFEYTTEAVQKESHPHSLAMIEDAPNYKR